jgi:hypothetical protein
MRHGICKALMEFGLYIEVKASTDLVVGQSKLLSLVIATATFSTKPSYRHSPSTLRTDYLEITGGDEEGVFTVYTDGLVHVSLLFSCSW